MSKFFAEPSGHLPLKQKTPVRYTKPMIDPAHKDKAFHAYNGDTNIVGAATWSNDVKDRFNPQVTQQCQQCYTYFSEVWCDDHERYLCTWCNRDLHAFMGARNHLRKPLYDSSTQKVQRPDNNNE